jgi:hypothetical protein
VPKAIFPLDGDSDVDFDGLSVDSQHAIAARQNIAEPDRGESPRSRYGITTRSIIPYFLASRVPRSNRVASLSGSA